MLTEPMFRQRFPSVPEWLPAPFQRALGGETSTLAAGIPEHARFAANPVFLDPGTAGTFANVMQTFGERGVAARSASNGPRSASCLVSAAASLVGIQLEARRAAVQEIENAPILSGSS